MSKKLIMACMAAAAFAAFILPASASASPVVTHPTGTRLDPTAQTCTGQTGVCITATNTTIAKFKTTGGSTLTECSTVVITGRLIRNTGTEIEGDIHTATFSGTGATANGMPECTGLGGATVTTNGEDPVGTKIDEGTVPNGAPWCLTASGNLDKFFVRGGTCAEKARPIEFILDSTTAGTCKYQRATPLEGEGTTDTSGGDAILHLFPTAASTEFKKSEGGILCPLAGVLEMSFTLETDEPTAAPLYLS